MYDFAKLFQSLVPRLKSCKDIIKEKMGSKNLKVKKKVKVKKRFKKFQRLKEIKRTQFSASELCIEPNFVETLSGTQDIFINRLSDQQIYSRSYVNDDDIPKIKKFTQVREQYFSYLQKVIKNNCEYHGSPVAEDTLDSLSHKLEQHALLSSFQIDIYENFLTKIISDIEKCTNERQIHNEVKKLLPDSEDFEKCLETTTVSNSTDNNLNESEIILADQSVFNSETIDQSPLHSQQQQQHSETCTVRQDSDQLSPSPDMRTDNDYDKASNDNLNFTRKEPEGLKSNEVDILQSSPSIRVVSSPLQNENDSSNKNEDLDSIPNSSENYLGDETSDVLNESSKLIEKCMEQIFSQSEGDDKALEENEEREYLIRILEDGNTLNDGVDNYHSEKESECVEKETKQNLNKRLEKMRALFNIEERKSKRKLRMKLKKRKKSKPRKTKKAGRELKVLPAWKNEKTIQLYKVSILASRLSYEKREKMQGLFIELFGEDSDEEHEFEYGSTDRFRTSCIDRISGWVVKHLMPFYHKRRIIGRKVFKNLGRHISEAIIDKIQYPDERTVKYFVYKFFPPNKRYGCKSKLHR